MNGILIAVITVAAIGLIAGIILTLASHFMAVEVDETVAKVRECLPGANCGACGYAGCDEYAEKVAGRFAKLTLCIPGGKKADFPAKIFLHSLISKEFRCQTEKRTWITSPSLTTYSLPSIRSLPACCALTQEPQATRSS